MSVECPKCHQLRELGVALWQVPQSHVQFRPPQAKGSLW
jgi:hypothetical protein